MTKLSFRLSHSNCRNFPTIARTQTVVNITRMTGNKSCAAPSRSIIAHALDISQRTFDDMLRIARQHFDAEIGGEE